MSDSAHVESQLILHYHALRMALDYEIEGQRKKGRLKRTWTKQIEEERCKGMFEKGRCTLPIKEECWR